MELDVYELLSALVDKSMVSTTAGADGTRYQLLESIRVFAVEHLGRADERTVTTARHARYYAELAAELQRRQRAGDLASALAGLDEEEDNFRAALRFAIDTGDADLAARLIDGLGYLWYASGVRREGLQWCEALFGIPADLPDELRAGALHSYALMCAGSGDPGLGIDALREQVIIRRRLGDPVRLAAALNNLGNLLFDVGDADAAELALSEAIDTARAAGEPPTLMLCSLASGKLHGGSPGAEELFREALAEAKAADYMYGIADALAGLGHLLAQTGRADEAQPYLVEARKRFVELNVTPGIADVDLSLAVTYRSQGDRVQAARCLLRSLRTPGETWYDESPVWAAQHAAAVIDDLSTAALLIGAAMTDYERSNLPQAAFVLADLDETRRNLTERLGDEEFALCTRAGATQTRTEVTDIATRALQAFIDAHDDHSLEQSGQPIRPSDRSTTRTTS